MTIISDEPRLDLRTPIQQFYSGQNIFVTGDLLVTIEWSCLEIRTDNDERTCLFSGGTGFLGKVLIEKLLRSCSEISSIYVLVRPKKNQDVHRRMENIFDDPVNVSQSLSFLKFAKCQAKKFLYRATDSLDFQSPERGNAKVSPQDRCRCR